MPSRKIVPYDLTGDRSELKIDKVTLRKPLNSKRKDESLESDLAS